jgi:hypothetical protein
MKDKRAREQTKADVQLEQVSWTVDRVKAFMLQFATMCAGLMPSPQMLDKNDPELASDVKKISRVQLCLAMGMDKLWAYWPVLNTFNYKVAVILHNKGATSKHDMIKKVKAFTGSRYPSAYSFAHDFKSMDVEFVLNAGPREPWATLRNDVYTLTEKGQEFAKVLHMDAEARGLCKCGKVRRSKFVDFYGDEEVKPSTDAAPTMANACKRYAELTAQARTTTGSSTPVGTAKKPRREATSIDLTDTSIDLTGE